MDALDDLFRRLDTSDFRRAFRLNAKDHGYLIEKGMNTIRSHAADFIAKRLSPAEPVNDGRQTPMRGHPVFVAQHATATCCRGCLAKWHGIAAHKPLTADECRYIVTVVERWLFQELKR